MREAGLEGMRWEKIVRGRTIEREEGIGRRMSQQGGGGGITLGETCSIRVEIISGNPGTHALTSRDLGHCASPAQVLPVGWRVMDNAADCLPVKPVACHTPGPYREVIIEICVDLHKI